MNIKTIISTFIAVLLTTQSAWAEVRATLSRQTISEGDTVTLNIMSNMAGRVTDPDLSVLQQDFDILGTGSSQHTQIINGRRSESHQWHVELAPKRGGELAVPAIRVGDEATQPLTLTVTAQAEAPVAVAGQSVFMKAALEPLDAPVHVQQQIRYTLQLFYREPLYEGNLDGPQVENALVEQLGDDIQFQTTVNGQPYQVLERHYAIFPEQSGPLTISPVTFTGRLAGQSQQRFPSMNMSDMMERFFGNSAFTTPGKRLRLRSEDFALEVQPRPDSYTGKHWLPARQLSLTDSWTTKPPQFRSGEPVTRTITLEATGLESAQLPDIDLAEGASLRLYPEKPVFANRTDGEWVIGSRQQSVAYVPSAPGMLTIPAIQIDWWDITEQKQKTLELPAWTVNVLPGEGMVDAATAPPVTSTTTDTQQAVDETSKPRADVEARDWFAQLKSGWPWFAGLALLLVLLAVKRRRRKPAAEQPTAPPAPDKPLKQALGSASAALHQACQDNDPSAAARALLDWATTRWPDDPPRNLGVLAQRLSSGVNEIRMLERALYGAGGEPWQGDSLRQAFDQGLQERIEQPHAAGEGLSPLYPDWKT